CGGGCRAEPRERGPMAAPLKLAEGSDQVVGAFHPVPEQREHMARRLLPALKPLAQIRFATLRANLGETSRVETVLTFGDAAKAGEGKKAIADGVKLARFALQLARLRPPEGLDGAGLDRMDTALTSLQARQNGQKLSLEVKAEGADLLIAAAALWASSR